MLIGFDETVSVRNYVHVFKYSDKCFLNFFFLQIFEID